MTIYTKMKVDNKIINLPEEYEIDQFTRKRNNQDIHINSYGEKIHRLFNIHKNENSERQNIRRFSRKSLHI